AGAEISVGGDEGRTRGLSRKGVPAEVRSRASSASSRSSAVRSSGSLAQATSSRAWRSAGGRSATWWNSDSRRAPFSSAIGSLLRTGGLVVTQTPGQPGAGKTPVARDAADRPADDVGGFLHAQSSVVAKQDDLRQVRLFGPELLDRLVQRQQVVGRGL